MYITGNQQQDHSTLSRFRKAHLDLLSNYFLEILLISQAEGISDFSQIAIDGTKFQSKSSVRHNHREDELAKKIEKLRSEIRTYMQRCDFVEQGATDALDLDRLRAEKERLERIEQELLERKAQLQERKKQLKPEHRSKHQINIKEPEARLMPSLMLSGYNAQLGVDMTSHLIIAEDVVTEPNDQGQFLPLQQKVESSLGPDGQRSYTADSGYHTSGDLKALEDGQVDAVINDPQPKDRSIQAEPTSMSELLEEGKKLKRRDFVYHEEEDYYECPAGKALYPVEKRRGFKVYRSVGCAGCSLFNLCVSNKKKVKQIHRSEREGYAERMAKKLQTSRARRRLRRRSQTVEPVIGNLKQNLGFRRFSLLGLSNVRGEFTLMCIGHNINILFKWLSEKGMAGIIALMQEQYDLFIVFSRYIGAFFALIFAQRPKTKKINLCLNM